MRRKFLTIFVILVVLMTAVSPNTALAGAYETDFVTSITYQNIGTAATTTLNVLFYDSPTDISPQVVARPNLAANASTSLYIGSVISSSFEGTAVMAADQPLAATLVQNPPSGSTVKVRPLSTGFSEGGAQTLLATVRKNDLNEHTVFVVQNAGTCTANAAIKFYNTSATLVHTINQTLEPGAGVHVDTGVVSALGSTFNGSVVVDGTCTTSGTPSFVSSAMELGFGSNNFARAFEGSNQGATTVYMPSALCAYGSPASTTYYAVQNTSLTTSTNVTVTYSNGKSETKSAGPGAKASFSGCGPVGQPTNWIGSATITSSATPVVAVGKVSNAPGGLLSTAFLGFPAGAQKIALPYVRWGNSTHYFSGLTQRTYIAIQNLGAPIPAGTPITIQYVKYDGTVEGIHTITTGVATGGKVNSNPTNAGLTEFGCYSNCTVYGGGAVIIGPAGSQLAVVARLTTWTGSVDVGEDYNGIPYP